MSLASNQPGDRHVEHPRQDCHDGVQGIPGGRSHRHRWTRIRSQLARRETSIVGRVLMIIVFLGLLGATVALALSAVIA
jgi:hypothetical protein